MNFQVMKDLSLMEKTNNSALIHLFLDMMEFFLINLYLKNSICTMHITIGNYMYKLIISDKPRNLFNFLIFYRLYYLERS